MCEGLVFPHRSDHDDQDEVGFARYVIALLYFRRSLKAFLTGIIEVGALVLELNLDNNRNREPLLRRTRLASTAMSAVQA